MKVISGYVTVVQRAGSRRVYIYGDQFPVLDYNPMQFVPFDTVFAAKRKIKWASESSRRAYICHLSVSIAETPEDEEILVERGSLVVFSKPRLEGQRYWKIYGRSSLQLLLELKPYTRTKSALNRLETERCYGEAMLGTWHLGRIIFDPELDGP